MPVRGPGCPLLPLHPQCRKRWLGPCVVSAQAARERMGSGEQPGSRSLPGAVLGVWDQHSKQAGSKGGWNSRQEKKVLLQGTRAPNRNSFICLFFKKEGMLCSECTWLQSAVLMQGGE